MKKLSLTTFFLFLFCLCLRGYSYHSYNKLKSKVTNSKSILNENKSQSIALLNTLDVISRPNKSRTVASEKKYKSQKEYLEITFINDFYEPIDNLHHLKSIQEKIKDDNRNTGTKNNALEELPIKLLFYLVIKENFDLTELRKTSSNSIYGFDKDQLKEMRIKAKTTEFLREILLFKNIPLEEIESQVESKETLARLEQHNQDLINRNENEETNELEERNEFYEQLPEEVKEQIFLAENEEVDLEEKLTEMEYTEEEIEEIIEGYQY